MPTPASRTTAQPGRGTCLRQRLTHGGEFRLAPDKAGEATHGGGWRRLRVSRANSSNTSTGSGADRDGAQRARTCTRPLDPQGRGGQPGRSGRGQLLHACRQMRRLSHRRVVHVQVVTNGSHHHFSGVQSHPDTHLDAVGAAHRLGILAHGRLHGQGGVAGAQGVVLMGQGRSKGP